MKHIKEILRDIGFLAEDSRFARNCDEKRFMDLIIQQLRGYMANDTKEAAKIMANFLKEGLDVFDSIKALHGAKFDPDTVNKMMDDFAEFYNTSPLEYQDNLDINRDDLIKNLENLYMENE